MAKEKADAKKPEKKKVKDQEEAPEEQVEAPKPQIRATGGEYFDVNPLDLQDDMIPSEEGKRAKYLKKLEEKIAKKKAQIAEFRKVLDPFLKPLESLEKEIKFSVRMVELGEKHYQNTVDEKKEEYNTKKKEVSAYLDKLQEMEKKLAEYQKDYNTYKDPSIPLPAPGQEKTETKTEPVQSPKPEAQAKAPNTHTQEPAGQTSLLQKFRDQKKNTPQNQATPANQGNQSSTASNNYTGIKIDDLKADHPIAFNVYMQANMGNQFILFRPKNTVLEKNTLEKLKANNVQTVFIETQDMQLFQQYLLKK